MFNAEKVKNDCVHWIKDWFAKNGSESKAIVGISGGKDSSCVAALCKEALGVDRVVAVMMPNGEQKDIEDSHKIVLHLGIENIISVNIKDAFEALKNNIFAYATLKEGGNSGSWMDNRTNLPIGHVTEKWKAIPLEFNQGAEFNTPPRLRMTTLYAVSAMFDGRVANTSNLSEDVVGWSTLYGDHAGDFAPISKLTCSEVIDLGLALGLPTELMMKPPADGLTGQTDEDNLGITYAELDEFIRTGDIERGDMGSIPLAYASSTQESIKEMWTLRGKFKSELVRIPCFDPGLSEKWKET